MLPAELSRITALAEQYWLLPVGMIVIYFFARFHFNTPDYALAGDNIPDSSGGDTAQRSPLARLRTPAPPIFTTPRDRYRKAEIKYVIGLEIAYLCLTLFPDLLSAVPNLQGSKEFLAKSFTDRAIVGALLLTGFLSSFPIVREFDSWLLKTLHAQASIPDDAEQTADELFEVGYRRCPNVMSQILSNVRSPLLRAVAAGQLNGSLENRWLSVRCLEETLRDLLQDSRYRTFNRKFRREFQEITSFVARTRQKLVNYITLQNALLPLDQVRDIDDWLENNVSNANVSQLKTERDKLSFEVDAIFYRMCLFTSLVVYATEHNLNQINAALLKIGFPVRINVPPRKPWDAVVKAGAVTLVVCLILSMIYTMIVQGFSVSVGIYARQVPTGLKEAGVWALTACVIHTIAALMATIRTVREIKRRHKNGLELAAENPITRNAVIALQAAILPGIILVLFALVDQRDILDTIWWIALPFTTAFFTGSYTRSSLDGTNPKFLLPVVQGGFMAAVGVLLSLVLVPDGPVQNWPLIVWVFTIYVGITAGGIGLTLGWVFKLYVTKNVHRYVSADEKSSSSGLSFAREVSAERITLSQPEASSLSEHEVIPSPGQREAMPEPVSEDRSMAVVDLPR
jgi:hypothetical protein